MKLNFIPTARKPAEFIHGDAFTFEQTKFLTFVDTVMKYAQVYPVHSFSGTEISDRPYLLSFLFTIPFTIKWRVYMIPFNTYRTP